jgi:hypothetical protein
MIIAHYVPSISVRFLFLKMAWIAPNCVELPRNTPLCAVMRPLAPIARIAPNCTNCTELRELRQMRELRLNAPMHYCQPEDAASIGKRLINYLMPL